MQDAPIRLEDVRKIYRVGFWRKRKTALDGVNLMVRPGEIYGYLGPNGAGKTTTIKLLVGLLRPTSGTLSVLGRPPGDPNARRRLGFMPENPYFYDYLTVSEYLEILADLHRLPRAQRRERIDTVLERVGLERHRRHRIRQLSKGLLQRFGLAQAVLHEPELLILDEPMSGLDPLGRWEIREFILSLRGQCTIFFSSHILADAELLCDRVGILQHGRLVHEGTVRELIESQVRGFEIVLTGAPPPDRPPTALPLTRIGNEWKLWCAGEDELDQALRGISQTPGLKIRSVQPIRRSLEELFIETIRGEERP